MISKRERDELHARIVETRRIATEAQSKVRAATDAPISGDIAAWKRAVDAADQEARVARVRYETALEIAWEAVMAS